MSLLEEYKNRLTIAEQYYSKLHDGEKMSNQKKIATACCLKNISNFINESFENSVGTQRSDLGFYKKFALNITTTALPNLIAHDLVIVYPMASASGYFNYLQYTTGSNKGETKIGEVYNDPFHLGNVDVNYTSAKVVDPVTKAGAFKLAWTPVVKGAFTDEGGVKHDVKFIAEDGTVSYLDLDEQGQVTTTSAGRVVYLYDNVVVPQNDIPVLNAKMRTIPLMAKARRIAIYYSQIAAFTAKQDYGFDLGANLSSQAIGRLEYEIDTEVTNLLVETAGAPLAELTWSKTLPVGVSKTEHYIGFGEVVSLAGSIIYDRTKRWMPNYMLCASDIIPILNFIPTFKPASTSGMNGPYFAGTLGTLKVYVSPNIEKGTFALGVNGDDYMSSVAVYAPYMPVVPTQLLQYADGGTSQGFSTMYDLKVLNKDLIVAGKVTA